ncbi:D-alanyl-D-alanine carboxypeptidase family protein [Sandaracinobacter sp.]|uniref:D-alanyl-D-alanine carboxypeptidase family protein n=1 Tax=Sandaracinobacter sp. TaxID=2487581 RepID=UPI0035B07474
MSVRSLAVAAALTGLTVQLSAAAPAEALSLFDQQKYAAFVADAETGEVLYSRRADMQRFPASITKVMTLYMVFEQLAAGKLRLDDRVVVSRNAASQRPSKLGLKAGESLTVDQAIRSLATKSANDISVALAEHIAGSTEEFSRLMTVRAKQLGMTNSRFVNPNGLPDSRQITTARDIFILSQATIRNFPQYYSYYQQQQFVFGNQVLPNHNHLLRTMPGVDGIKTGFTNAAGFTLAASAVRDGRRLIAVVLGGPTRVARDSNVESRRSAGVAGLSARDRGQQVQVADLLAEPGDLNDETLRQLVEQGSGDAPPRKR